MPAIYEELGIPYMPEIPDNLLTTPSTPEVKMAKGMPMTEAEYPATFEGLEEAGDIKVAIASFLLESAVTDYGAASEKGKIVIRMLNNAERIVPADKREPLAMKAAGVFLTTLSPQPAPPAPAPQATVPPLPGTKTPSGR